MEIDQRARRNLEWKRAGTLDSCLFLYVARVQDPAKCRVSRLQDMCQDMKCWEESPCSVKSWNCLRMGWKIKSNSCNYRYNCSPCTQLRWILVPWKYRVQSGETQSSFLIGKRANCQDEDSLIASRRSKLSEMDPRSSRMYIFPTPPGPSDQQIRRPAQGMPWAPWV